VPLFKNWEIVGNVSIGFLMEQWDFESNYSSFFFGVWCSQKITSLKRSFEFQQNYPEIKSAFWKVICT
jgi:hypothetical protein